MKTFSRGQPILNRLAEYVVRVYTRRKKYAGDRLARNKFDSNGDAALAGDQFFCAAHLDEL